MLRALRERMILAVFLLVDEDPFGTLQQAYW